MNRRQAQDLIANVLEIPHEGELQVLLNGIERLGTRFNDCAVSQNALRQQTTSSKIVLRAWIISLPGVASSWLSNCPAC